MIRVGIPYSDCPCESAVPCTREDEALAFAAGVILGGGECEVFMQNDGFLQCLNIITTFLKPYYITIPMLIKVKHTPDHHYYAGKIMPDIMKALNYETSNRKDNVPNNR